MKFFKGFILSILIHGLLLSGGFGYIAWKNAQAGSVMEIDLKHSSLLFRPHNAVGQVRAIPPEPWYLTTGKKPVSAAPLAKVPVPVEPPEEQTTGTENPIGNGPPGPPAENWVPAAAAARIPEWMEGMITEDDYPAAARKQGKEGRVVATIVVDAAGHVQEVEITEGSYPEFNQLVMERLKKSRFQPGRDQNDRAIAVRMSIPIAFELH
jgi:TonB family protein